MPPAMGQAHPNYGKLRSVTAEDLRRHYIDGGMTTRAIGAHYGVSHVAIRNLLRRFEIPRRRNCHGGLWGERNPNWKGSAVGYTGAHDRVRKLRGTPKHCGDCKTTNPHTRYEWSNNTGRYDDPSDYTRRCISCHRKRDARKKIPAIPAG